jgi:hypothetical protein
VNWPVSQDLHPRLVSLSPCALRGRQVCAEDIHLHSMNRASASDSASSVYAGEITLVSAVMLACQALFGQIFHVGMTR